MGCSTSLAKLILIVFNIVFVVLGLVSIGVGIWVRFSKDTLFNFINLLDADLSQADNKEKIDAVANQNGLIVIAAIVLIAVGAFTLVVGFCGCCGAAKESTVLLNIYAILIGLVLLIQITAAVLAAVFQSKIKDTAEKSLYKLQNKYFVSLNDYISKNSTAKAGVTYFINWLQVSLECCGTMGNESSWKSSNLTWEGKELQNPVTCCQLKDEASKTEVQSPDFDWRNINQKLKDDKCPYTANSPSLHSKTCSQGIINFVSEYSVPLIAVSVVIALIQLLGIAVACCLVNALRHN